MLGGYQILDFGGVELDPAPMSIANTFYNPNNYANKQIRVTGISLKDQSGSYIISPRDIYTMNTIFNDQGIVILKCLFTFESKLRELIINQEDIAVINVVI